MIWALVILNIVLVALLAWEKYQNRLERAKLINAVISKTAGEMISMDLVDKREPEKPSEKKSGEIYPLENMPDDEFSSFIKKQNG